MGIFNIFTLDFWIQKLYFLPAVVIGLSFHEFAHAYVAHRCGDDTAKNLGRMTLNPLAHVDWIGFVCMMLFGFGWAKPVPVNPNNYRGNRRKADILVSVAGITMNLLIAIIAMFLLFFLVYVCHFTFAVVLNLLQYIVILNLGLLVFNLIPVPPLDGSHIAEDLLAPHIGFEPFFWLRKNGMFVLIAVIFILNSTGLLSAAMSGLYSLLYNLFSFIFGGYIA